MTGILQAHLKQVKLVKEAHIWGKDLGIGSFHFDVLIVSLF